MMKAFLDELSELARSLSQGERRHFAAPFHWVCLGNGDADFHDNVIFFGFDASQSTPVLVAKVPRLVENGWMLKTEYDHLRELWNCIGPEAVKFVPEPYSLASIQGRQVLVISYLPGESLARLWHKSFWESPDQVGELAREAARTMRQLNDLTKSPTAEDASSQVDLEKKVNTFRELFPLQAEEERELSAMVNMLTERSNAASHRVLIQGDFWHGNIVRDMKRRSLMFVDWQFARWSTDVSLDIYFFLLAGALSATGDGPVAERAKAAYRLLESWRSKLIPEYLAAYGTPENYVLLPQKYGMMLCCVEKSTRSALEFGYSHPDDLMWRYLFAELQNWPQGN